MAAYDIQKHFSGLRVQTARRKDPFSSGFDDDSDDNRKSRSQNRTKKTAAKVPIVPKPNDAANSTASPFAHIDALRADSDDDFLDLPAQKRIDRRPSPAPNAQARRGSLPGINSARKAAVLAAGQLAYLDDSDDDEALPVRRDRRPSPAPRAGSDASNGDRSRTPLGGGDKGGRRDTIASTTVVPKHTVASPFAGTKYLQDSDSDEEAVSSRKNSAEDILEDAASKSKHLEVKRVDKPTKNGSGVSWRAFSASRAEQRFAEVEALQTSLRKRGRAISFSPHATTDDGERVPLVATSERSSAPRGRKQGRSKSPPRRAADVKPTEDELRDAQQPNGGPVELYDPVQFKTNPFTVTATTKATASSNKPQSPPMASLTSASTMYSGNDSVPPTPVSPTNMTTLPDTIDALAAKLTVSPQTIPESAPIDHSLDSPLTSPATEYDPISRNTSTRSLRSSRQPKTISSRRASRRSTGNTSVSPAHAFLSSWGGKAHAEETAVESQPDDEGQSFGVDNKYVIGRTINRGGFGVVKEVHALQDGRTLVQAVKIVRKTIPNASEAENDRLQQEIEHEVSIWRHLDHRHILKLHAVYDTDFATFCVMDLNVGGTLHDLVGKARQSAVLNGGRKGLPPHLAKSYAYQLACALRYLHEDIRVCHRDVKLENCLIDLSGPNVDSEGGNLRLCDFGLADFLHGESIDEGTTGRYSELQSLSTDLPLPTASSIIGTLEYASPKGLSVNRKLFETAGDVWAFGVIVYALCTGDLPFRHPMPSKTAELILRADWDETALRDAAAGGGEVIDLVKGCLEKEIDMRYTISDALRSTWFEGCREDAEETTNGWR